MSQRFDDMAEWLAEQLGERFGGGDRRAEAAELLEELGLRELLDEQALSERVIHAADGFHPVARFFAEGSPEQRHILRVLARRPV